MSQSTSAPGASSFPHRGRTSDAGPDVVGVIDRWIFVFMAGLFVATVLVGFVPDSIAKIQAVRSGARPPFMGVLHLHAVLMGSWMLLLLAQTTLAATGRSAVHRKLGLIAVALAPAMVITGLVLVPATYHAILGAIRAMPPAQAAAVQQALAQATFIMLFQIRVGVLFPLLVGVALLARRSDPETHKRLMIIATALPLPAAIDRVPWMPTTLPGNPLAIELYTLLWVSPMLAWDLFRTGRVQRAYWLWLVVTAPFAIATQLLWGSPWWLATVPKLMGVS